MIRQCSGEVQGIRYPGCNVRGCQPVVNARPCPMECGNACAFTNLWMSITPNIMNFGFFDNVSQLVCGVRMWIPGYARSI